MGVIWWYHSDNGDDGDHGDYDDDGGDGGDDWTLPHSLQSLPGRNKVCLSYELWKCLMNFSHSPCTCP